MEELLEDGGTQVSDLEETPDEVIAALQRAAVEQPRQLWRFYADISDRSAPTLTIGLRDDRGALSFYDGRISYRPAVGLNAEPEDYWWAGHYSPAAEYSEIPVDDALLAVREFLNRCIQPTSVDWVRRYPYDHA